MSELFRYVDYNLTTGNNDGTSLENAFRGTDALNVAIANMDTYAKQCITNGHVLRLIIKGLGCTNTSMTMPELGSSWQTSSTYYVQFEVYENEKHSGYIDESKFLIFVTGDALWLTQNTAQSIKFKNMQFRFHNWGGFQLWSYGGTSNVYVFENCIFDNTDSTRYTVLCSARGFNNVNAKVIWIQCSFINWNINYPTTYGCINFSYQSTLCYMEFHNCQFNNVNTIIYDNYGSSAYMNVLYRNCIFDNVLKMTNSGGSTYITESESCLNNVSNTTIGPSGATFEQTFTFQNEANDIYLITSDDTGAKDQGVDNSGYGYNTDILGTPRPQGPAWDCGTFEVPINISRKRQKLKLNLSLSL